MTLIVSVVVTVSNPDSSGTLVHVSNQESILQAPVEAVTAEVVAATVERLGEDVIERAKYQSLEYARRGE